MLDRIAFRLPFIGLSILADNARCVGPRLACGVANCVNIHADRDFAGIAKSNWGPSCRNLRHFYKSKIGDFVILHNAAAFYILPRRLFALDDRLKDHSYVFVALYNVPVCYDVPGSIEQRARPEALFGSDQYHCR